MKELWLNEREVSVEYAEVFAGKLMDCLHNLKELHLVLCNLSLEMEIKLKTRGDEFGCKVFAY